MFETPVRETCADTAALEALAARFAAVLVPGDAVALRGALGAGKTTFVAAIVRALGSDADVSSPTFVFRQRYHGTPPVEHLDLYRIDDPTDAIELGLDDAFDARTVTFVEWPDRLPGLLPARHIAVEIVGAGEAPRTIAIERRG